MDPVQIEKSTPIEETAVALVQTEEDERKKKEEAAAKVEGKATQAPPPAGSNTSTNRVPVQQRPGYIPRVMGYMPRFYYVPIVQYIPINQNNQQARRVTPTVPKATAASPTETKPMAEQKPTEARPMAEQNLTETKPIEAQDSAINSTVENTRAEMPVTDTAVQNRQNAAAPAPTEQTQQIKPAAAPKRKRGFLSTLGHIASGIFGGLSAGLSAAMGGPLSMGMGIGGGSGASLGRSLAVGGGMGGGLSFGRSTGIGTSRGSGMSFGLGGASISLGGMSIGIGNSMYSGRRRYGTYGRSAYGSYNSPGAFERGLDLGLSMGTAMGATNTVSYTTMPIQQPQTAYYFYQPMMYPFGMGTPAMGSPGIGMQQPGANAGVRQAGPSKATSGTSNSATPQLEEQKEAPKPKIAAPTSTDYETLGVTKDDEFGTVRRAYKVLALKYHPDKNPEDPVAAAEKFKQVVEAYEKIKNQFGETAV